MSDTTIDTLLPNVQLQAYAVDKYDDMSSILDAELNDSPTLQRLIAEVENDSISTQSYNRTHNRHNR